MKLLDIILEDENTSLGEGYNVVTKEGFLNNMKGLFPYKGGCLYDFPNLEDFRKIATVNAHCNKHNIDFPVKVEYLTKGGIGSEGCVGCKKDKILNKRNSEINNFYNKAEEIWKDENGNPLYIYNKSGLRKYTGIKNEFDFYCPKLGLNKKPHGKQTLTNPSSHIYQNHRYPNYPYQGCKKCQEEQGIVRQSLSNLSRIDFIKKVQEKMKSYDIPIDWYDWEGMEYVKPTRSAKIKCIKHNQEVTRGKALSFYTGTPLCPECNRIAVKQKNFMDKVRKLYNDRFVLLSDYIGGTSPVTLGCTLHGKTPYPVVIAQPSTIWGSTNKYGSIQCKECFRVNSLNKFENTIFYLNKKRKIPYTYPNLNKEFKKMTEDIPIVCHRKINGKEHGMFWQTPNNHRTGQGCPICQESRNERHISNLLNELEYKFIKEKRFSETGNLEYDFYIPKYKVIIEYDGIQHFEPRFGKSEYSKQDNYNKLYDTDNIKNDFVKSNKYGLRMIRIPHTLKEGTYDKLLENALKAGEKNEINFMGDFPERQLPKEAVHKDKINFNKSKLSLMNTLKNI
jgi:very-short-patch-repair endonuclease/ribosomal protein S14